MIHFFIIFGLTTLAVCKVPEELKKVEAHYKTVNTLSALFSQSVFSASTHITKISSGLLYFQKPGSYRWETLKPDSNILISNSKTLWFYTPPFEEGGRGQLNLLKSTDVDSQLITKILLGDFSFISEFKSTILNPKEISLVPKKNKLSKIFAKILLEFDPVLFQISKVSIHHKSGNQTEITFSGISINPSIDKTLFNFVVPKDTDTVTY